MIAYLINQYPQASQSFIRREIAALQAQGVQVARFTVRRWNVPLVDPADQLEQTQTRAILEAGPLALLLAVLQSLFTRPASFFRALALAFKISRRSDRGLILHLIYLAEACLLRKWLGECGATHLHAHFGTNSTTVAMLCHVLGGPPYSFTCHGPEEFDKPEFLALPEKIRRAAFVIAISDFGRSQLFRWCPHAHWNKIHVVHCGVDDAFLSSPAVPPPDTHRLVCVGRIAEQKGQLLLAEAAARLLGRGIDFEIILVGDGPMRGEIEQLIAKHQLGGHVKITGYLSNAAVREQLQAARAMVLPSFAEGLPVVIMEALALRRPVLASAIAGIPELVKPGESGWLIPAGSVDALADAMQQVLATPPTELARMGEAGAALVAANHNAHTEAAKLAALFTSLLPVSPTSGHR
jgi:glycosyltransferase involved in cell wall biosynthesis